VKDLYVESLPLEQTVTFLAVVKDKQSREKKNGEPYLHFMLGDKTGEIEAKLWEDLSTAEGIAADDVVKVQGPTSTYKDKPQLTIKKIRKALEEEIDERDYLPCSRFDPDETLAQIQCKLFLISDAPLRNTLLLMIQENERAFKKAPAAMKNHHAFVGGLMDHILSLMEVAEFMAAKYSLSYDLMIAACLLHDFGKVRELEVKRSIGYSTEGSLLGHVAIGLEMFTSASEMSGMDPQTSAKIKHIILSHHGNLEWGALKVPMFAEAVAFHFLDNLDARMEMVQKLIREASGDFTPYVNALGTMLYAK
jgi:3'-5' exoribonuclease